MLSLSFRFARRTLLFPTPKMYSISLVLSVPRGGCATKISWNLELTEIVCALTNDAGFQGPKEQHPLPLQYICKGKGRHKAAIVHLAEGLYALITHQILFEVSARSLIDH